MTTIPNYSFKREISEDPQLTDDSIKLLLDGKDTNIDIQVCGYAGGYGVNSYDVDADGHIVSMTDHGVFRSLKAAKEKAITIHLNQKVSA